MFLLGSVFGKLRPPTLVRSKLITLRRNYCTLYPITCGMVDASVGVGTVGDAALENKFKKKNRSKDDLLAATMAYTEHEFRTAKPQKYSRLEDKDIVELAQRTKPAVVRIQSEYSDAGFGCATGFFVDEKGLILTNAHVVQGNTTVTVITDNNEEFEGVVQSSDAKRDLAVIRIRLANKQFPIIKLADSDSVKKNDFVMVLGSPNGKKTRGMSGFVISGAVLSHMMMVLGQLYYCCPKHLITIPIAMIIFSKVPGACGGTSGAPLINKNGEAVGVVCGGMTLPNSPNMPVSSIPSNAAKEFLDEARRKESKQI